MLDESGYPTEETLEKIKKWDYKSGYISLMDFIEEVWYWGFRPGWKNCNIPPGNEKRSKNSICYYLATGGWSGNESIIEALCENYMFWSICWVQSSRGGAYWFEIPEILQGGN